LHTTIITMILYIQKVMVIIFSDNNSRSDSFRELLDYVSGKCSCTFQLEVKWLVINFFTKSKKV